MVSRLCPLLLAFFLSLLVPALQAEALTRAEVIRIAETYVNHRWSATEGNKRQGKDASGIAIQTPDRESSRGSLNCWTVGDNTGVAYKWGGFDTPEKFSAGVRSGKGAGDVYTSEKRRKGGAAVSGDVVGVDCSGFISRCWKLSKKQSTQTLPSVSKPLNSPDDLKPGDIMNQPGGHVILFVRWTKQDKSRALFYEAEPFSKTLASEMHISGLTAAGYSPLRFKQIKD